MKREGKNMSPAEIQALLHVDERFPTFYNRLDSLRRPGETDKEFAARAGVKLSTFRKWKYGVHRPQLWSRFMRLSARLSIGTDWLARGHDDPRWGLSSFNDPRGFLVFAR
jgi:hypothetical protein